jgi:hypothetical protein
MREILTAILFPALMCVPATAKARSHPHPHVSTKSYLKARCSSCARDSSKDAKVEFKHSHPCPSTGRTSGACPGYVVALKHGGSDTPANMRWQTKAEPRAKALGLVASNPQRCLGRGRAIARGHIPDGLSAFPRALPVVKR